MENNTGGIMQKIQFMAVEADTGEQANAKVLQKMIEADVYPLKWFNSYRFAEDADTIEVSGKSLIDHYHRVRFDSFSEINEGLDTHQVAAGIWAYGDDSKGILGLEPGSDIERRFKENADKMIKSIEFVDNRWTANSVIFDLENLTADLSDVYDRLNKDKKQFLVPILFTY